MRHNSKLTPKFSYFIFSFNQVFAVKVFISSDLFIQLLLLTKLLLSISNSLLHIRDCHISHLKFLKRLLILLFYFSKTVINLLVWFFKLEDYVSLLLCFQPKASYFLFKIFNIVCLLNYLIVFIRKFNLVKLILLNLIFGFSDQLILFYISFLQDLFLLHKILLIWL